MLCFALHLIALRQSLTKPTDSLVAINPQQSGVVPCPVLVLQTYLTFYVDLAIELSFSYLNSKLYYSWAIYLATFWLLWLMFPWACMWELSCFKRPLGVFQARLNLRAMCVATFSDETSLCANLFLPSFDSPVHQSLDIPRHTVVYYRLLLQRSWPKMTLIPGEKADPEV